MLICLSITFVLELNNFKEKNNLLLGKISLADFVDVKCSPCNGPPSPPPPPPPAELPLARWNKSKAVLSKRFIVEEDVSFE